MKNNNELTPPQTDIEIERLKNERSARRMQYMLAAARSASKYIIIGVAAGVTLNVLQGRKPNEDNES